MSGTLAEYKTSFHRSYPCVVFLSAKKPMRVVDRKRITKVEKVTSFSSFAKNKFYKLRPFGPQNQSASDTWSGKHLFKPTQNRYEYDEYVKKLFDIIQENCYLIYVK